jgi:1-deoxy-D-xylulose-5-phosphate synthase
MAKRHAAIVTVEEGCVMGGAGSAVLECLHGHGVNTPVLQLGLPDRFIDHGDPAKLLALAGLDPAGIEKSVRDRFAAQLAQPAGAQDKRRVA